MREGSGIRGRAARAPLGLVSAGFGYVLASYVGHALWVPGAAALSLLLLFNKTPLAPRFFRGAIAVSGALLAWFLVAALIVEPRAVIDVALVLVPTLWLWAAPGRRSALGFGLYQLVFLVLNFVQWQSSDFGSREHRALSGHLTLRIVALAAVVVGYQAMKRARVSNSIAREAPPHAGRPRGETASAPTPAVAPEQREIEPSSEDNACPPRRVALTEGSPSEVTAGIAPAPEAKGVPHVASAPAPVAYVAPVIRRALGAIGAVVLLIGAAVLVYAHLRKVPACELEREAGGARLANACYAAHAASREDPGLCDAIESEPSYNAKDRGEVGREGCLRGVAKAAGKPALCGQVRSDSDTAACLKDIALAHEDASLCSQIAVADAP